MGVSTKFSYLAAEGVFIQYQILYKKKKKQTKNKNAKKNKKKLQIRTFARPFTAISDAAMTSSCTCRCNYTRLQTKNKAKNETKRAPKNNKQKNELKRTKNKTEAMYLNGAILRHFRRRDDVQIPLAKVFRPRRNPSRCLVSGFPFLSVRGKKGGGGGVGVGKVRTEKFIWSSKRWARRDVCARGACAMCSMQ